MFSVGIVGLPNVGKSTLFKALTKKQVDISNYPFCTIEPNIGIVAVPDKQLDVLANVFDLSKTTPTVIEFVDIAGLVKNAHKGEGLGNQFLARIREVNVICQIVRIFESEKISHVNGTIDPQRDIIIVNNELIAKDLETIEQRIEKTKKEAKSKDKRTLEEINTLEKIKTWLKAEKLIRDIPNFHEIKNNLSELFLLTCKPIVYVFNKKEGGLESDIKENTLYLDLKNEVELSDLSAEEIKQLQISDSKLDQLIRICYDILELITFYTIAGGKELRAWTLKKDSTAFEAAGLVHSDFQEKFIKAEVIDSQALIDNISWTKARETGKIKTVGRDYIIQNNEVVEFKI